MMCGDGHYRDDADDDDGGGGGGGNGYAGMMTMMGMIWVK